MVMKLNDIILEFFFQCGFTNNVGWTTLFTLLFSLFYFSYKKNTSIFRIVLKHI